MVENSDVTSAETRLLDNELSFKKLKILLHISLTGAAGSCQVWHEEPDYVEKDIRTKI